MDSGLSYVLTPGLTLGIKALALLADGSVLAATDSGIYRAASPGGTWTIRALPGVTVAALLVVGSTIFAAEIERVSYSLDGAQTFSEVPDFTGTAPRALAADPDGGVLVGTSGHGLHRIALP